MRSRQLWLGGLLVLAALAGCTSQPEGSVSVYLAAEPAQAFSEVQVNVSAVHVRPADAEDGGEGARPGTETFPDPWVEVALAPEEVTAQFETNASSSAVFFGEGAVPTGDYDAVGVRVDGATGVSANGTPVTVSVADAVSDHPANVSADGEGETRLVLRLDLEESLTEHDEQPTSWALTPIFAGVDAAQVDDDAWGEEQHSPGEQVTLQEG